MAEAAEQVADNPDTAYESSDWPIGWVGLALLGIFLFLVIAPLVLMASYPSAVSDVSRKLTIAPPGPRLQTDPAQDLARFRAEEDRRLDRYYWIDREKGIVHIPIGQAIEKALARGLEGFPKAPP
ncbi:MAG: hypothetical protein JO305_05765 [Alphaproteobacteria bacterium]|nr:hypothetical protein [Alphaproteobacteria bacterium]